MDAGSTDAGSADSGTRPEQDAGVAACPEEPRLLVAEEGFIASHPTVVAAWGTSPSNVWVIRSATQDRPGSLSRFRDGQWQEQPLPPSGALPSVVDGRADDDVWFGGKGGVILHWDGSRLKRIESNTTHDIIQLQVLPDGKAWAATLVSQDLPYESWHNQLLAWDGRSWSVVLEDVPLTYTKRGSVGERVFLATEAGDVWFATTRGLFRWHAGVLERLTTEPMSEYFGALWASGPEEVWVGVGTKVKRWNGSALVDVTDVPREIRLIWGTGPGDVWFVPQPIDSERQLLHWDGSQLTTHVAGPGSRYDSWMAMSGTGPKDVWAICQGDLLHWDGQTWKAVDSPIDSTYKLWRVGPSSFWFLGSVDAQVVHWNGQSGQLLPETGAARVTYEHLKDVWALSPTDVWAVGNSGTALHRNGTGWTVVPTPTQVDLTGVSGTSSQDVWAVGKQGVVLHWDGTAWQRVESGTSADLEAVWAGPPGFVIAVGDQGTVLQLREGHWSMSSSAAARLTRVWARAPDDVWVTDVQGSIYHSSGPDLSLVQAQQLSPSGARGMWGMGTEGVLAAGLMKQGAGWGRFVHPDVSPHCHACLIDFIPWDVWEDSRQRSWFIGEFYTVSGAGSQFGLSAVSGRCTNGANLGQLTGQLRPHALHGAGGHDLWVVGTYGRLHHVRY